MRVIAYILGLLSVLCLASATRRPNSYPLKPVMLSQEESYESYQPGQAVLPDITDAPWPVFITPFLRFVPMEIAEYCQCRGFGDCGCCIGFAEKPLSLRNNVCVNVTVSADPFSLSYFGLRTKIIYDRMSLIELSVSDKEPPRACVNLIPFTGFKGCATFSDIHYDLKEAKTCVCANIDLRFQHPVFSLPKQCLCIGKPVPQWKKLGALGLPALSQVFDTIRNIIYQRK